MKVGDIIKSTNGEKHRFWEVTGVYLGVEGQESVVSLVPMERALPSEGRHKIPEMFVPVDLIYGTASVFTLESEPTATVRKR